MNEEKIIKHLVRIENKFDGRFDSLDQKIDREVGKLRDEITTQQDKAMVILQRLDQERVFTQRWIERLEENQKQQGKEISRIKKVLKIA